MLCDARQLDDSKIIEADLCIIGAGPAATAVALSFDGLPISVVILEAGGLDYQPSENDDGRPSDGMRFGNVPDLTNLRQIAGNANLWNIQTRQSRRSVRLLPLTSADFEPRAWLADSGWPIGAEELEGYYRRAQLVFGLPALSYNSEDWEEPWARMLPLRSSNVRTSIFQFGNANAFLDAHRRTLEQSSNITVLHHATALEIMTDQNATHVTELRVASLPSRHFRVRANHFVLAAGGLASAQLLLSSDSVQPGGLGNAYDNVGRYFMDHPLLYGGDFLPASPRLFDAMEFYDLHSLRGTPIMGHLQLTDEALRREPLLNLSAIFFPRERNYRKHRHLSPRQQAAFDAALRIRQAMRCGTPTLAGDRWRVLKGLDGVAKRGLDRLLFPKSNLARGGWSSLHGKKWRFDRFEVLHQAEQAPHRDNRVYLTQERNRFGARRLTVDWRWHDDDVAATMRAQETFAHALQDSGLGCFQIAREDGRPVLLTASTSHYMGTTRMHANPREGVVDAQCRVHGIDNLFIASSSVFPTGGFANPTLTVVALALRISDRIRALQNLPVSAGQYEMA